MIRMNKGIPFVKIADRVEVTVNLKGKRVSGPPLVFQPIGGQQLRLTAAAANASLAESRIKALRRDFSARGFRAEGSCDLFLLQNLDYNFGTSKT